MLTLQHFARLLEASFEPPPKMYAAILSWVRTIYAGAVYGKLSEELSGWTPSAKEFLWQQDLLEAFYNKARRLGLDVKIDERLLSRSWKSTSYSVRFSLGYEFGEGSDALADYLAKVVFGFFLQRNGEELSSHKVVRKGDTWELFLGWGRDPEKQKMLETVRKITRKAIPTDGIYKETRYFPADLRGWYQVPDAAGIEVKLHFRFGDILSRGGISPGEPFELSLILGASVSPKDLVYFERALGMFGDVIHHELMHYGQYLTDFGSAPRKHREHVEQIPGKGGEEYARDDSEFQTHVWEAAAMLAKLFSSLDSSHWRDLFHFYLEGRKIAPELQQHLSRHYLGVSHLTPDHPAFPLEWFVDLKRYNPKKWSAAVKRVYKELAEKGYRL